MRGLVIDNGYMIHTYKNIVSTSIKKDKQKEAEKLLFSLDTAQRILIEQNRWAK